MREPPPVLGRLPEQYFKRLLAAAAAARERPGPRVVDLGRGNPDIPPPAHAVAALTEAASRATPAVHGYPPFAGLPSLKEAVAERYAAEHGVTLDPASEIAVLPGTKTGIMLAAAATAGPGTQVVLPDPGYPDYLSGVALAGARVATVPLRAEDGFQPDLEAIDAPDPALLVLNFPSNPCAVAAAPGTLAAAVAWAREHGAWLLHDLAYDGLLFDGRRAASVLAEPGARELAVELWSPSKIYGMAGWRVGVLAGAEQVVARVQTLVDHTTVGVFSAVQHGLEAALRGDGSGVAARRDAYAARRDVLLGELATAGAPASPCEGTFYVWWQLPPGLTAERLLAEHRVVVAAGEGFGRQGAGWARLSLAIPDEDVAEGARRLAAAVRATG